MSQQIETTVQGIPCIVNVTYFKRIKGNPASWASDLDYYGYDDMNWELLDRNGRPAPWLEAKLNNEDYLDIEAMVSEHFDDEDFFEEQ